jgi:hypothetical protein
MDVISDGAPSMRKVEELQNPGDYQASGTGPTATLADFQPPVDSNTWPTCSRLAVDSHCWHFDLTPPREGVQIA